MFNSHTKANLLEHVQRHHIQKIDHRNEENTKFSCSISQSLRQPHDLGEPEARNPSAQELLNSTSTQTILTHQNGLNRRTTHWVPESAAHKNEQEKQHEHQPHDVGFTRERRTHTRKHTRRRRMYVEKISREQQQKPASYNTCDCWNTAVKCATCTHHPMPTMFCPDAKPLST